MAKVVDLSKYRARIIDKTINNYLEVFGAVCIEGPKWCGKSWTSSYHSNSEYLVGDPRNNYVNRERAKMDPYSVLDGETPRLIDEWQEVPPLWDAVRYKVDERGLKSQFILTGSSTPKLKGILHSGVGRIGILNMRTMSLFESGDSSGVVSLEELCKGTIKTVWTNEVSLCDLANYIVRGGWPGNINISIGNIGLLSRSYITTVLKNDLPRMDDKKYDIGKMHLLLRSLARNESTTASNNKLISDITKYDGEKIEAETVATYIDVFNRMFLLDNQEPFSPRIRSSVRVKKMEKRHFTDPALACALLDITPEKLMNDLETFGFMFEALCERDLKIYAESFGAKVYHYQDYNDKEIDTVIELSNGDWCAFEIKLGANQIDKAAKSLIELKNDMIAKGDKFPKVLCVICGLTNVAYQREDGVFVVPITALKN